MIWTIRSTSGIVGTLNTAAVARKTCRDHFVKTLKSNALTTVMENFDECSVTDTAWTRHMTDEVIELDEAGERFRRVTLDDLDEEVTEYLATLPCGMYLATCPNVPTHQTLHLQTNAGTGSRW